MPRTFGRRSFLALSAHFLSALWSIFSPKNNHLHVGLARSQETNKYLTVFCAFYSLFELLPSSPSWRTQRTRRTSSPLAPSHKQAPSMNFTTLQKKVFGRALESTLRVLSALLALLGELFLNLLLTMRPSNCII